MQRKAREDFRAHASEADPAVAEALWARAKDELKVWTRQGTVYSLYARPQKSVMVRPSQVARQSRPRSPVPHQSALALGVFLLIVPSLQGVRLVADSNLGSTIRKQSC